MFKDRSKLKWVGIGALLVIALILLIVGLTAQPSPVSSSSSSVDVQSSSVSSSSSASSSTSSLSSGELVEVNFDNAEFSIPYPSGFQPRNIVPLGNGSVLHVGMFIDPAIPGSSMASATLVDASGAAVWTFHADKGYEANQSYVTTYYDTFMNAVISESEEVIYLFGVSSRQLVTSDNQSHPIDGIFEGAGVQDSTGSFSFILSINFDGTNPQVTEIFQDVGYTELRINKVIYLANEEFILLGATNIRTGLWEDNTWLSTTVFAMKAQIIDGELVSSSIIYVANTGFSDASNFIYDAASETLLIAGQTSGNTFDFANEGYQNNDQFAFIAKLSFATESIEWIGSMKGDADGINHWYGAMVQNEDGIYVTCNVNGAQSQTAIHHYTNDGVFVDSTPIGDATTTIYFIAKMGDGYLGFGTTSSTSGVFQSAGLSDFLFLVFDADFNVTDVHTMGGSQIDAMSTWPGIAPDGTMYVVARTQSTDGDWGELVDLTDVPYQFVVIHIS